MMDYQNWLDWHERLPSMDEENFYRKYLTPPENMDLLKLRRDIYNSFPLEFKKEYDANPTVAQAVNRTVERFVAKASANPALYSFVYDTDEAAWGIMDPEHKVTNPKRRWRLGSDFFVPWIANCVPHAIALEVVYGYGVDSAGRYRKIGRTDPFFYFTHKNDLFAAIMERGRRTVSFLEEKKPEKMGFLGAGMAPEFRHLGLTLDVGQGAVLVDNDPTISPGFLFKDLPFRGQLSYLATDLKSSLKTRRLCDCDVLVANGVIPYIWESFSDILSVVKRVARPGGTFIFELYPEHWEWARNKAISGFYLPLKLFKSNEEAIDAVFAKMKENGFPSKCLEWQAFFDDFGNELMVTFRIKIPT